MKKCCMSCKHISELPFDDRLECQKGCKPKYTKEQAFNQYCNWWKPIGGERKK